MLHSHIAEIDKQANDMFFQLVKELAEKENITEKLIPSVYFKQTG